MASPIKKDWDEADKIASELTARILRGNLARIQQHVKAVLTAYFAHEAAERREFAQKAFTTGAEAASPPDDGPLAGP
jgi:hypothetical protein